jgi:hypothetical protein
MNFTLRLGACLWLWHASTLSAAPVVASTPPAEGFRGIWFTLGQKSAYGDKYSGGLGTNAANHVPMAIHHAATKRTYFTWGAAHGPPPLEKDWTFLSPIRIAPLASATTPPNNATFTFTIPPATVTPIRISTPTGPMEMPILLPPRTSTSPTKPAMKYGNSPTP